MQLKKNIAVSESGFLFNPTSGDSFSLNPIAVDIVNLLKAGKNFDEIKEKVLQDYATDSETFEKDYYDFINVMKNHKLIENGG